MKLILFVLILFSCRTNPKLLTDKKENTIVVSEKKEYKGIDTVLINNYIKEPNHDIRVVDHCQEKFKITDDKKSIEFIDFITQKEEKFIPIYFYVFNRICENSDGSLSEVLGKYCLKVIINHPKEVFSHFETNNNDLKRYSSLLGYEFYFCKQGTSDLEMNYEKLKEFLTKELNMKDKETKETYNLFCSETENTIKKMD